VPVTAAHASASACTDSAAVSVHVPGTVRVMQSSAVHVSESQGARVFGQDGCHVQPSPVHAVSVCSAAHVPPLSAVPTQADGTQCAPGCVSEQRPTGGFGYGMAASMIHSRGHSASSGDMPTVIFVRLAMYTEGEVCANSNVQRARDNRHTRLF
jgi:hypothetical protein